MKEMTEKKRRNKGTNERRRQRRENPVFLKMRAKIS